MASLKPPEAEKQLSKYRYGREEILAMFAPALPVPSDLRDMTIFCMRELLPVAFLPVTEDEQAALLQCVNSNLALRSTQRAVPMSQGGRPVAAEPKRGRGRGRTDASLRNSKASDARSETSESVCSDDWRKQKISEKAEGPYGSNDRVARAPSKSEGLSETEANIQSLRPVAQQHAWTLLVPLLAETQSTTSESISGRGADELDTAEDLQATQFSERLSFGVATSLPEVVNFKTAHVRAHNSGAIMLSSGLHNETESDQLDRRKFDSTTTFSCDSVISSNGISSRNQGVDRRLSTPAPPTDTKHCSGDGRQLSVNYAKGKVVDKSVESCPKVLYGDTGHHTNVRTDDFGWSKAMCDKDTNVCDDGRQWNGLLTAESAIETWFYKDPNGQLQGPFTSRQMEEWFLLGYFTMKLFIRPGRDGDFVLLGDLIKAHGRVPFLSYKDEEKVPLCRDHSLLPDRVIHGTQPLVDLPFHQQFIKPAKAYSVSSLLPDTVAPPLLHSQRLKTHFSSAASVASQESGWPLHSMGNPNSKSMVTVNREKIEEELKKKIEKQLKEKMVLEFEREKLRLEQLKIEEERRLMIEHHRLLEDEKRRQEERRKMEEERRQLEEERRKLEELHRKAEEERRLQEHRQMERQREELERRKLEEDRKLLEEERYRLEELHRKTEEDRHALEQLRENWSNNSGYEIDPETIVIESTTEEERFEGEKWCSWKDAVGVGEEKQLNENSEYERRPLCYEGRMLSINVAESDMKNPDIQRQRSMEEEEEASDTTMQKGTQVPKEEESSDEKHLSLKNIHETRKKLVPWNSSSKNEMEKQCSPTSTVSRCPWATSLPSASSQPSPQPQDLGNVKGDEQMTSCAAQKERLDVMQQQKKQTLFNWSEQKRMEVKGQSKVQSFLKIQEEQAKQEEEEKKRKFQQQQQLDKVSAKTRPQRAVTGSLPRRNSASAKGTMPPASLTSGAPGIPGLMSVPVAASVPYTTQPWNPNGHQMAASTEMNDFMVWCHRALPTTNSSVDVRTLIEFLKDVESPYELYDYIRLYLGDSKQVMDFAHEFLERRKRLQMRMNRAALDYRLTPVYPSFTFGYQTGSFYQPYGGNLTNPIHQDKVKGQNVML